MKAVVGRVSQASVHVDNRTIGSIDHGMLVLVAIYHGDNTNDARWLAEKITSMRMFKDEVGKLNRSVVDIGGKLLLIPNFTLAGRTRKGNRPSFTDAADPTIASPLFTEFVQYCAEYVPVETGSFGSHMDISAQFDGPVTLIIDTP